MTAKYVNNILVAEIKQKFFLPVQLPSASDRLVFSVWDEEKVKPDKLVGSMFFSIKELVKMGEQEDENSKYFW